MEGLLSTGPIPSSFLWGWGSKCSSQLMKGLLSTGPTSLVFQNNCHGLLSELNEAYIKHFLLSVKSPAFCREYQSSRHCWL